MPQVVGGSGTKTFTGEVKGEHGHDGRCFFDHAAGVPKSSQAPREGLVALDHGPLFARGEAWGKEGT